MLFDYLVVGQVVALNPASSVRGPKYVVKKGKTPVLSAEEARQLLDSIDVTTIGGLRDRAFIAVMAYSFARVGAVISMTVDDYYPEGKRWWLRLHEKGGKQHAMPCHHNLETYLHEFSTVRASQTYGSRDRRHSRSDSHLRGRRGDRTQRDPGIGGRGVPHEREVIPDEDAVPTGLVSRLRHPDAHVRIRVRADVRQADPVTHRREIRVWPRGVHDTT